MLPLTLLALAVASPRQDSKPTDQAVLDTEIRPSIQRYCAPCHGKTNPQAGIDLSGTESIEALQKNQKIWQSALRQLKDRAMPPAGLPQPTLAEHERLSLWLGDVLSRTTDGPKDPGRVLLHRLNRDEYNNTVRDLFGVSIRPADKFPSDSGGGGGFDNNADTLFVPPVLLERYLMAADETLAATKPERLFFVTPGPKLAPKAAARKILGFHASRAWRRPASEPEISRLLALYDGARSKKASHEDGVKLALRYVLISPHFLFRVEKDQGAPGPRPLDDYELASRLSYFLWSSMPDDTLFALARTQQLSDPLVLDKQVARMLVSPKAKALSESFVGQWLRTRELYTTAQPDPGKFPQFTPTLRDAMFQESTKFFGSLVSENTSLLKLIDADYTYLNEELARHYQIEGISGPNLRRVTLNPSAKRGGLLGMGAVHVLTSYPQRTSPVLRGKWILSELLGTPPPPPPPVVATLSPSDAPEAGLTFRQRLEKHREKPECAGCHSRMDPLGFGLENFDALGRWRDKIGETPVDSSGILPGGAKFDGPQELKKQLLGRKDDFIRHTTEKMLSYALGRGLEPSDLPAVRKITDKLAQSDYKAPVLIREIARSYPFTHRMNEGQKTALH